MHLHLDWLSCCLTIASTILVGRKLSIGWIVAGINSVLICVIGAITHQYGFIPANILCICLYVVNVRNWSCKRTSP